jgi:signal transduction histidine kinase
MRPRLDGPRWSEPETWAPEAVLAGLVLVYGLLEISRSSYAGGALLLLVLGFTVATAASRHLPGAALVLVWAMGVCQVLTGTSVLLVEFAVVFVAFGCARWGREVTVVLSGLSIPLAGFVVAFLLATDQFRTMLLGIDQARDVERLVSRLSDTWQFGAALVGAMALVVPWLAGLTLRFLAHARRSQASEEVAQADAALAHREAEQAQEIARLRDDQARLARDVHDVVGHSLAVILAQAESAQYLPDDPATLKQTLATVAESARTSLDDVRRVLAPTPDPETTRPGGFDDLVAGVRSSGREVVVDEVGAPRPLPPELEVVAYRVMQEMLTNAVRHGRRDRPILVERHWPQDSFERDLRLEVSNALADAGETQPLTVVEREGQGLPGMRRRVEAVGGRLDVRRRTGPDGPTFTSTAWVPVRA